MQGVTNNWESPERCDIVRDIQASIERMKAPETQEQYLQRMADWRVQSLFVAKCFPEPFRQQFIDAIEATTKGLGLEV